MKKIEAGEYYKTKNGMLVYIYSTEAGGPEPIHGAIWNELNRYWQVEDWTENGYVRKTCDDSNFDLVLTDWKEQIPWEKLKEDIKYVTWSPKQGWKGHATYPTYMNGVGVWCNKAEKYFDLGALKMPDPHPGLRLIAKRPEED